MAAPRRAPLSLLELVIVIWLPLASLSLSSSSVAFVRPTMSAASAATGGASATSAMGAGGDDRAVFRYESPFFPASGDGGPRPPAALVILNTPIKAARNDGGGKLSGVLGSLWEASSYRICADGGANRLYDSTVAARAAGSAEPDSGARYVPDLITGDLDSLRQDVREYYEARGASVVRVEDQDFHDLDVSSCSALCVCSLVMMSISCMFARVRPTVRNR